MAGLPPAEPEEPLGALDAVAGTGAAGAPMAAAEVTLKTMDVATLTEEQRRFFVLKAAQRGDLRRLQLLVGGRTPPEALALLQATDDEGYTPLHRASYNARLDVMRYLLLQGCNPRAQTNDGWEPLHCATRWNKADAVEMLLRNGACVNAQTHGLLTPLHLAARGKGIASMAVLVTRPDIDITLANDAGETAADLAWCVGPHGRMLRLALTALGHNHTQNEPADALAAAERRKGASTADGWKALNAPP